MYLSLVRMYQYQISNFYTHWLSRGAYALLTNLWESTHVNLTDVLSVRVPPAELNILAFPPVLRDWVTKAFVCPASSMRLGI